MPRLSSAESPDSRRQGPLILSASPAFVKRDYSNWRIPAGAFHFKRLCHERPQAYAAQVKFLTGLPFVLVLEIVGIYIPLLYHSFYGFYIWFRGKSNVSEYPWAGNFMYAAQRWTGAIAFAYIVWHTYTMRFTGIHLLTNSEAAFHKVQMELQHWWAGVFYLIGDHCRIMALCLRYISFLRQVGHHRQREIAQMARPGMHGACAYFDYRRLGHNGGIFPATVEEHSG